MGVRGIDVNLGEKGGEKKSLLVKMRFNAEKWD
jgi:hypothetical protein